MSLDDRLLSLLVCPEDKQPLEYLEGENLLYNTRLHRAYDIRDGIPVLLIDEAHSVDESEHTRLRQLIEVGASLRTGPPQSTNPDLTGDV